MKNISVIAASLLLTSAAIEGLVAPQSSHSVLTSLHAKSKGFGAAKETSKPKSKPAADEQPSSAAKELSKPSSPNDNPFAAAGAEAEPEMNSGAKALERMRRQKAEERNAELRKIKELKDVEASLQSKEQATAIPEKVAQRMGSRMLPFVGIPLFGSMAAFVGFWYMATYRDMEFQPALVAASTIVCLGVGLVGITYSIMSTSWDEDREGSFLGTEEFSTNLENIKKGLSRSKENAMLREKMYDYSPDEIDNVDKVDAGKAKRKQSFGDKLGGGMD
ncbi:unnamed protein product [Cylindrotheca closterium]|uniref:Uncharacterized protein n=1 Tax=Cylindrotheca closterium TaxID=2856 RepID=A0AAD2G0G9_9STRA|nr:unnamed protein product [Cylindrotheca closterium]